MQDTISQIAGALLSVGFAFIPGLKTWFDGLKSETKAGLMAVLAIVAGIGVWVAGCYNLFGVALACDSQGAQELVRSVVNAILGLAGAYVAIVRPIKAAKTPAEPPQ